MSIAFTASPGIGIVESGACHEVEHCKNQLILSSVTQSGFVQSVWNTVGTYCFTLIPRPGNEAISTSTGTILYSISLLKPYFIPVGGGTCKSTFRPQGQNGGLDSGRTATELLYNLCSMIECGGQLVLRGTCGPKTSCPQGTRGPRTSCPGGTGGPRTTCPGDNFRGGGGGGILSCDNVIMIWTCRCHPYIESRPTL